MITVTIIKDDENGQPVKVERAEAIKLMRQMGAANAAPAVSGHPYHSLTFDPAKVKQPNQSAAKRSQTKNPINKGTK